MPDRRTPTDRRGRAPVVAVVALMLALPASEAAAQGLFESLFGAFRAPPRPIPSQPVPAPYPAAQPLPGHAFADPSVPGSQPGPSGGTGRATTYCVRLCDGRYFPVARPTAGTPNQLCQALCPASRTKVFHGSEIKYAVAADGSRYGELDNAFVYRERVVADCTCNGRDAFGTAPIDASRDPTLRPGDIVTGGDGVIPARTAGRRTAGVAFDPVPPQGGPGSDLRRRLSTMVGPDVD